MHLKPCSTLQSGEQPSPSMLLPSSHSSPSTMPSPHVEVQALVPLHDGSFWQSDEQPSNGMLLPSSQPSAPSILLSPHVVCVHVLGLPSHFQPISILQPSEQPSPLTRLPSSHCSGKTARPSPQRATGRHGWPGVDAGPAGLDAQAVVRRSRRRDTVLPSSQASSAVSSPLPQVGVGARSEQTRIGLRGASSLTRRSTHPG